ncbi:MAG: cobalamin-binding protein, partial [Bacteroidia bacterium]|nr:cobalamin-binding protein [Bacteroidia bacterium]
RYPAFDGSTMEKWNPELILLSSEPYPFKEKHLMELRTICPHAKLKLVDGELFSWYGSRLINSGNYLKNLQAELL